MFERFTERARQVVIFAQDETRRLGHDHIGREHLLLGLLPEEEGLAPRVLESVGVTPGEARQEVLCAVGRGEVAPTGQGPSRSTARSLRPRSGASPPLAPEAVAWQRHDDERI